jgi:hypothetical protein
MNGLKRAIASQLMFSDIDNHWARACIVALAERGMVSGYANGVFRPLATLTRAEFAALMPKVFPDAVIKQTVVAFNDVPEQFWAYPVVSWASERALMSGYGQGPLGRSFGPRLTISRTEAVVVLMAGLAASQGVEVGLKQPVDLAKVFEDADAIPAYAKDAIAAALNRQLLEPLGEARFFLPNQAITRGEACALICRALAIPVAAVAAPFKAKALESPDLFSQMLAQEAGFDETRLAFLDRTIQASPYRNDVAQYGARLQSPMGVSLPFASAPAGSTAAYPKRGKLFFVNESGLEFLPADILSACVCLLTMGEGAVQGRWLGRDALSDRQLWSATKFIPLLNLAARANRVEPNVKLERCWVRPVGSVGKYSGYPFAEMAAGIMTYDNRISTSNAIAAMFKQFNTPEGLEKWLRQMTGNESLSFRGRYGEVPFIDQPELWSAPANRVLLKSAGAPHQGQNLLSTYDLTRLITMMGGHWQLPLSDRIPDLQGHGVISMVQAMGLDAARYVDVALETLGLVPWVRSPVIISKSGFGRSDERDRMELSYCAYLQFGLPRSLQQSFRGTGAPDPSAVYQRHTIGMTLLAAKATGDADEEARYVDALMATAVTEIIRRLVANTL